MGSRGRGFLKIRVCEEKTNICKGRNKRNFIKDVTGKISTGRVRLSLRASNFKDYGKVVVNCLVKTENYISRDETLKALKKKNTEKMIQPDRVTVEFRKEWRTVLIEWLRRFFQLVMEEWKRNQDHC